MDPVRWVVGRRCPLVMDPKGDWVYYVTTVTVVETVTDVIILPNNIFN